METLKGICGNDAEAQTVMNQMVSLGILNENGDLDSESVNIDGKTLALSEVRELVNDENTDLSRIVTVGGTSLSLENLKTMVGIEDEIQRVKDKYFNDNIELSAEQAASLASIQTQLDSEGIRLFSVIDGADVPSGINHDIYAQVDTSTVTCENGGGAQTGATVTLKDAYGNTLTEVPDYDITIDYRFVDSSALNGTNYSGTNGTLTFAAGSAETTRYVPFTVRNDTSRFNGQKAFLIQLYNPEHVVLKNDMLASEIAVKINKAYEWKNSIKWSKNTWFTSLYAHGNEDWVYDEYRISDAEDMAQLLEPGIYNAVKVVYTPEFNSNGDFYGNVSLGDYLNSNNYDLIKFHIGKIQSGISTTYTTESNPSFVFHPEKIYQTQVGFYSYQKANGGNCWISAADSSFNVPGDYPPRANNYYKWDITFYDAKAPQITNVSVPQGISFQYGESVPITVTFSEPVDISDLKLLFNTDPRTFTPVESGTGVRQATFLYTVKEKEDSSATIGISTILNAVDLSGHGQEAYVGKTLTYSLTPLSHYYSLSDATASSEIDGSSMTGNVTLNISDNDLTRWIEQEASAANNFEAQSIYASVDGGTTKIPLYYQDGSGGTPVLNGTFTPDWNTMGAEVTRAVEFYYTDGDYNNVSTFKPLFGKYAAYTVDPVVFLTKDDFSIEYDQFPDSGTVFAQDSTPLSLSYTKSIDATWDGTGDFVWSSSNTDVACIDQNGKISLTGTVGTVTFSLTAKNNDIEGKAVTITSKMLTVKVGLTPFLNIPEGINQISIQSGQDAEVRWTSNLIAKYAEKGESAEFTIELYSADYVDGKPVKSGDCLYSTTLTGSQDAPVASCAVPASVLTGVSEIGKYSFIAEVGAVNPYDGKALKALAYIAIASKPAYVQLVKPTNCYITDSVSSLTINWTLKNFDAKNNAGFSFEIADNSTGSSVYIQNDTEEDNGGSYTFAVPKVSNGYRNIYTITAKAKNTLDSTWSYDSYVLYVYSDDALKIWINGKDAGSSLDMSNIATISAMTSEQILALNRDIYLKNVISINYGDHAWGQISDQIKWKSSNDGVASINFKDISTYNNISGLGYSSYRPTDSFILSGLKDGSTTITATHAATGRQVTLDVSVETLKDKLYIFQLYPQAVTTLTYTNGNGESRTAETNEDGALALYEASGIASEIYMQSTYDGRQYMGTLYSGLVSSEKDSTKLELYPVNYFKLREVATAELYFKNPDGSPFSGSVTLRGGVYKNGNYCASALLNKKPGTADQAISIGADGKFTVIMDATQFWTDSDGEVLDPSDRLDFIFEVRFADDDYYPRLLDVHCSTGVEDAIKFGDKTVWVEQVPEDEKYKPYLDSQYVDYGFKSGALMNVKDFTGKIGPGQTSDEAKLLTTVLWWGEDLNSDNSKHSLTLKDEYGITPTGQTSESLVYPFSTIKATRNTFVMSRDTMDGWLESGEDRGMTLYETAVDGSQYKSVTLPFRVTNMFNMQKAEDSSEINSWHDTMSNYFGANAGDLDIDDKVIQAGLNFLCNMGIDSNATAGMFSIKLAPTADPTVFSAFICLNLGNMSNDNATGVYAEDDISSDIDATPSLKDIVAMQNKTYLKDQKKKLAKNIVNGKNGDGSVAYTLGGYMEAEVRYNNDNGKWEFNVLNGGFNAGGGYSYSWNYNTVVGGVPVTGQFTLGGTAEVVFKAAIQRGEAVKAKYESDDEDKYKEYPANTYLTTLRLYAYMRAFAGLGFDYSVVALRIGLFGQVSVDASFDFLNRPYISSKATTAQSLTADGKVGIEFVAKFLFVSYEKVIASASYNIADEKSQKWDDIQKTWKTVKGNPYPTVNLLGTTEESSVTTLSPVYSSIQIESRDYLDEFVRSWNGPDTSGMRLFASFGYSKDEVKSIETNAYPYSNPVLTKDGQIMMYVSDADSTDIEETKVCWTKLSSGGYPNGTPVGDGPDNYGDSQLKLAGSGSFAAAAWVRQSQSIDKDAGDTVTNADIALMSSSTEIMAAVYDGTSWTTVQLTDNASPDLAPAVATDGSHVVVAWRNVYATNSANPLDFDGADTILYKVYDMEGKTWSKVQTLYNGTSGPVKGLEAAMLDGGTACVAYTIEADDGTAASGSSVNSDFETVYTVVDPDAGIVKNVRLTNDAYLDENPQITTVKFGDGTERFVIGWFSEHDADGVQTNDIRLCAVDGNGAIYDNFIDSIDSVNANDSVNISRNFRFVNNADSINDLSILWTETESSSDGDEQGAGHDVLKAVKFRDSSGRIYLTAPLTVAEMGDYTLVDYFSVYNNGSDSVKAVLLGTYYGGEYKAVTIPAAESGTGSDETVYVPSAESNLYTASGSFSNSIGVNYVAVDYTSVMRGAKIPVQLSVYNAGVDPITGITAEVGGTKTELTADYPILPNESGVLTAYYETPSDRLVNPTYTVTAEFSGGDTGTETGTLNLDIPDIGIAKLETVSSESGERVMQVTLYNGSDSVLSGSGRNVKIGFYSDEDCTLPLTQVSGQEKGGVCSVDSGDFALIDAGAYTHQFTFNIKDYVISCEGSDSEIPDGGVRIYAKIWVEEHIDTSDPASGMDTIEEYDETNNVGSVLFKSLLADSGDPVSISTEQTNESGATKASVTLKNNSLVKTTTGNLIVSLLDGSGNILESRQSYDKNAANNGFITLEGEGTQTKEFLFDKQGASLSVSYTNSVLDDSMKDNAKLASLSLSGVPLEFKSGTTEYSQKTAELAKTLVSATTEDPNAEVTVNGSKTNLGNITLPLYNGTNDIDVVVTAADGTTTQTYNIKLFNNLPSEVSIPSDFMASAVDGTATLYLSDSDVQRLISSNAGSGAIKIKPIISGDANKVVFKMSGLAVSDIMSSGVMLDLGTPDADLLIRNRALSAIAGLNAKEITFFIGSENGKTTVIVSADGKELGVIDGGLIVLLPVQGGSGGTVALLSDQDGSDRTAAVLKIYESSAVEPIKMSVINDGVLTVPLIGSATFSVADNAETFSDTEGHWAKYYIDFVSSRDLFNGTGGGLFSPNISMSRGMIVTVLGRLADADAEVRGESRFSDVEDSMYYAAYVDWAAKNSIVKGDGNGHFMGEQPITREQLATIISNFINYMGLSMDKLESRSTYFSDADQISDYAVSGVNTLVNAGIIKGKTGNIFDPQGTATRAEVAAMLERLVENIEW
ncbi:MAG: S-layer homology domain-containing protein [Oscillospiraceae bacterium]|nr:S-layer homology domain-containing protein [Oscillospiraceae bacterium]